MAKKKPAKTAVCWECKKAFKHEAGLKDHATAKRHRWRSSIPLAPPAPLAPAPAGPAVPAAPPALHRSKRLAAMAKAHNTSDPAPPPPPPIFLDMSPPQTQTKTSSTPTASCTRTANWSCLQCSQVFYGPFTLDLHYGQVHRGEKHWPFCPDYYRKCPGCDRTYAEYKELRWHMITENACFDCGQHNESMNALIAHRRTAGSSGGFREASSLQTASKTKEDAKPTAGIALECASTTIPLSETNAYMHDSPMNIHNEKDVASTGSYLGGPSELAIPSNTSLSGVDGIQASIEDEHSLEDITDIGEHFDDTASVVSYASYVEISASDTVAPACESVKSYSREMVVDSQEFELPISRSADASASASLRTPTSALPRESGITAAIPLVENTLEGSPQETENATQRHTHWQSAPSPIVSHLPSCRSSSMQSPTERTHTVVKPRELPQRALPPLDPQRCPQSVHAATGSGTASRETGIATGHDHTDLPRSVSWHCRSCQKDPCDQPVATICGHIFCQGCICREISENGQCPVCQKVFLLRLDVSTV